MLACLYGLWVCGSILWEEYGPDFHRKKRKSEDSQKPSEPDNPPGGNLGKLGSQGVQSGALSHHAVIRRMANWFLTFKKGFAKFINFLTKLFTIIHRKISLFINGFKHL
jgi:hypothetical protein